jgi:hypothetical protein
VGDREPGRPGPLGRARPGPARGGPAPPGRSPKEGWYVLIHQLPPRPLYLRAKIRSRLARVGAVALKNSVYVLPRRDDCLEDLQWIAQEAIAGGGEAFVCRADFIEGVSEEGLVGRFTEAAGAAYAALSREIREILGRLRAWGRTAEAAAALPRLRKRLGEIAAVDSFAAAGRKEVDTMMRALEARLHGKCSYRGGRSRRTDPDLMGRTWVTRRDPKVDRLASAWLIRRFVDPGARFRFIDPEREAPRPSEIGFDMPVGRFTHEGERCTFETLARRLGVTDPAVRAIGEVVHDLDLKDGRYGRPEAEGVRQVLLGIVRSRQDDADRLDRGLALFEDLYASYRGAAPGPARRDGRRRPGRGPRPAGRG